MARQLTKKDQHGKLYVRSGTIERKIDEALGQTRQIVKTRAEQNDKKSPDYLPSEALVHIAREAVRNDDQGLASAAMGPLLKRIEANLRTTIPNDGVPQAESVRENVIDQFVTIVAQDGSPGHEDELDFFEVNFLMALRALRVDQVRAEARRLGHLTEMPEKVSEEGEIEFDADKLAELSRWAQTDPSQQHALELDELLDAVRRLPEKERSAVVLTRVIGFEEKDAAEKCGITDRALRYRLANATKRLKDDGEKK